MEMFEVGGCVRDEILGVPSKDIDFSVVLNRADFDFFPTMDPFDLMLSNLKTAGFTVHTTKPEFLTIRGKFPKNHPTHPGLDADFVLARKDGDYSDGRRPNFVELGTLHDDLARRDFTMNAIAKAADGTLIDPFGGQADIQQRIIRAVGSAHQRIIEEDALRGMRALRFAVQKNFVIDGEVALVLRSKNFRTALGHIAIERIQDELEKMFKADTIHSLFLIDNFNLTDTLFSNTGLRLMPTMKG
jgi:tRNA nucleotidyltransferase/poly(A) polymerase